MFGFVEKTWRYHQCRGFQGLIAWMLLIGEGVTRDLLPLSSVGAASREKLEGKDMKCDVKIGVGCYQNPEFPHGIALLGWVFLALLAGFTLNIKVHGGSCALRGGDGAVQCREPKGVSECLPWQTLSFIPGNSLILVLPHSPHCSYIYLQAWLAGRQNLMTEENMCSVTEGFILIYLK